MHTNRLLHLAKNDRQKHAGVDNEDLPGVPEPVGSAVNGGDEGDSSSDTESPASVPDSAIKKKPVKPKGVEHLIKIKNVNREKGIGEIVVDEEGVLKKSADTTHVISLSDAQIQRDLSRLEEVRKEREAARLRKQAEEDEKAQEAARRREQALQKLNKSKLPKGEKKKAAKSHQPLPNISHSSALQQQSRSRNHSSSSSNANPVAVSKQQDDIA